MFEKITLEQIKATQEKHNKRTLIDFKEHTPGNLKILQDKFNELVPKEKKSQYANLLFCLIQALNIKGKLTHALECKKFLGVLINNYIYSAGQLKENNMLAQTHIEIEREFGLEDVTYFSFSTDENKTPYFLAQGDSIEIDFNPNLLQSDTWFSSFSDLYYFKNKLVGQFRQIGETRYHEELTYTLDIIHGENNILLGKRNSIFETPGRRVCYETSMQHETFAGSSIFQAMALDVCIKLTYLDDKFCDNILAKFTTNILTEEKIALASELLDIFHRIEVRKIGGVALSQASYFRLPRSRISKKLEPEFNAKIRNLLKLLKQLSPELKKYISKLEEVNKNNQMTQFFATLTDLYSNDNSEEVRTFSKILSEINAIYEQNMESSYNDYKMMYEEITGEKLSNEDEENSEEESNYNTVLEYSTDKPAETPTIPSFDKIAQYVEEGINLNFCPEDDKPLLIAAIEYQDAQLVQLFVNKGARIHTVYKCDSAMTYAIDSGNYEILKILLRGRLRKASNVYEQDRIHDEDVSRDPLAFALKYQDQESIKLLLQYGAQIKSLSFPTVIAYAPHLLNPQNIVGFDVNKSAYVVGGDHPLLGPQFPVETAIRYGHDDLAIQLIESQQAELMPELIKAAVKVNNSKMIQYLRSKGLNMTADMLGDIFELGSKELLQVVLTECHDKKQIEEQLSYKFHFLLSNFQPELFWVLLAHGISFDIYQIIRFIEHIAYADKEHAKGLSHEKVICRLFIQIANENIIREHGLKLLRKLIESCRASNAYFINECVDYLLAYDLQLDHEIVEDDADDSTLLELAAGNPPLANKIIRHKKKITLDDFLICIKVSDSKIMDELSLEDINSFKNSISNKSKFTPLTFAVTHRKSDWIEFLVETLGVDVNVVDGDYRSALSLAVKKERKELVTYLVQKEAKKNLSFLKDCLNRGNFIEAEAIITSETDFSGIELLDDIVCNYLELLSDRATKQEVKDNFLKIIALMTEKKATLKQFAVLMKLIETQNPSLTQDIMTMCHPDLLNMSRNDTESILKRTDSAQKKSSSKIVTAHFPAAILVHNLFLEQLELYLDEVHDEAASLLPKLVDPTLVENFQNLLLKNINDFTEAECQSLELAVANSRDPQSSQLTTFVITLKDYLYIYRKEAAFLHHPVALPGYDNQTGADAEVKRFMRQVSWEDAEIFLSKEEIKFDYEKYAEHWRENIYSLVAQIFEICKNQAYSEELSFHLQNLAFLNIGNIEFKQEYNLATIFLQKLVSSPANIGFLLCLRDKDYRKAIIQDTSLENLFLKLIDRVNAILIVSNYSIPNVRLTEKQQKIKSDYQIYKTKQEKITNPSFLLIKPNLQILNSNKSNLPIAKSEMLRVFLQSIEPENYDEEELSNQSQLDMVSSSATTKNFFTPAEEMEQTQEDQLPLLVCEVELKALNLCVQILAESESCGVELVANKLNFWWEIKDHVSRGTGVHIAQVPELIWCLQGQDARSCFNKIDNLHSRLLNEYINKKLTFTVTVNGQELRFNPHEMSEGLQSLVVKPSVNLFEELHLGGPIGIDTRVLNSHSAFNNINEIVTVLINRIIQRKILFSAQNNLQFKNQIKPDSDKPTSTCNKDILDGYDIQTQVTEEYLKISIISNNNNENYSAHVYETLLKKLNLTENIYEKNGDDIFIHLSPVILLQRIQKIMVNYAGLHMIDPVGRRLFLLRGSEDKSEGYAGPGGHLGGFETDPISGAIKEMEIETGFKANRENLSKVKIIAKKDDCILATAPAKTYLYTPAIFSHRKATGEPCLMNDEFIPGYGGFFSSKTMVKQQIAIRRTELVCDVEYLKSKERGIKRLLRNCFPDALVEINVATQLSVDGNKCIPLPQYGDIKIQLGSHINHAQFIDFLSNAYQIYRTQIDLEAGDRDSLPLSLEGTTGNEYIVITNIDPTILRAIIKITFKRPDFQELYSSQVATEPSKLCIN